MNKSSVTEQYMVNATQSNASSTTNYPHSCDI